MIAPQRVFAATLAAGLARRFGADKLAQRWGETDILGASLAVLDGFDWLERAVVVRTGRAITAGRIIANDHPERGMGHSLALAAQAADAAGADFLLVTLGDMPCLRAASLDRLLQACPDRADAMASLCATGAPPAPPAVFGRGWFGRIARFDSDKGARDLLRDPANGAVLVPLDPAEAVDIDTPEDLARRHGDE